MNSPAQEQIIAQPDRIFAIGDLHGCSKELDVLLNELAGPQKLGPKDLVVCIGDYIDRGPDSHGVVEMLLDFRTQFPNTLFLKGNHEEMLLGFLGLGGVAGRMYLANGGVETLKSYNLPHSPAHALRDMPPAHREFFQSLERMVQVGSFVLVHAGLDPLRDLGSQTDDDLFWIRDTFINNIHHFGLTAVFGHTPFEDVFLQLPYKMGIDTGVVYGNKLSAVELNESLCLQIKAGSTKVKKHALKQKKRPASRLR